MPELSSAHSTTLSLWIQRGYNEAFILDVLPTEVLHSLTMLWLLSSFVGSGKSVKSWARIFKYIQARAVRRPRRRRQFVGAAANFC